MIACSEERLAWRGQRDRISREIVFEGNIFLKDDDKVFNRCCGVETTAIAGEAQSGISHACQQAEPSNSGNRTSGGRAHTAILHRNYPARRKATGSIAWRALLLDVGTMTF